MLEHALPLRRGQRPFSQRRRPSCEEASRRAGVGVCFFPSAPWRRSQRHRCVSWICRWLNFWPSRTEAARCLTRPRCVPSACVLRLSEVTQPWSSRRDMVTARSAPALCSAEHTRAAAARVNGFAQSDASAQGGGGTGLSATGQGRRELRQSCRRHGALPGAVAAAWTRSTELALWWLVARA